MPSNKAKGKKKPKKNVSRPRVSSNAGPAGQDHEEIHEPTVGPSNEAAQHHPQSLSSSRSWKRRSSKKSTSGSGATTGLKMDEDFTEELASQMESAFNIKDETKTELTMPVVPEETESAAEADKKEDVAGKGKGKMKDENTAQQSALPKGNTFKRRLRALTGGSAKSPPCVLGSDGRGSWQTKSSASLGASSLSAGSDSLAVRGANLAGSSTAAGEASGNVLSPQKRPGIQGKRSFTSPAAPVKLKYISPTDYMLLDMDRPQPRATPKTPEPGLLPKMKDAAQQALSKKKSGNLKPSKKYHKSALHIKNVDDKTPETKNKIRELIEYARNVTGTEVKFRDLNDPNAKQRKDDVRAWDTVNLRCISCRGDCPICNGACCMYADAKRTIESESADTEKVGKANRTINFVESLSPQVMDVGTYQLCSQPGGCGRYVCPNCCGVCPNEICRDIQCKECKEDPWGPCDWHD